MAWIEGQVRFAALGWNPVQYGIKFESQLRGGVLPQGGLVEIHDGKGWFRGQAHRDERDGWMITDGRSVLLLEMAERPIRARVWDGATWPPPERERSGRDR